MGQLSRSILIIFNLAALHINYLATKVATDLEVMTCPNDCNCASDRSNGWQITCSVSTHHDWQLTCLQLHNFDRQKTTINLKIIGNASNISENLQCLPGLHSLDMSKTFVVIQENIFRDLHIDDLLNISSNEIKYLPNGTFLNLQSVRELDLSHNSITHLEPGLFRELKSLKMLHLGFNNLHVLSSESFSHIPHLEYLGLESNKIEEFSSLFVPNSGSLRQLSLRGNALRTVLTEVNRTDLELWRNMLSLDISENLLECSCVLRDLYSLLPNLNEILVSPSATICASPEKLKGQSIINLNLTQLSCMAPHGIVSFPSMKKDVRGTDSVTLQCLAKGYPKPSILWITPWNEWFFSGSSLLLSRYGVQTQTGANIYTYKEYSERNVMLVSSIGLNSNSDLVVTKIRGSMSGNYTCLAFNIAGNISLEINLQVFSEVKTVVLHSLFMGGYSACCFLIFGLSVGSIKLLVVYLRQKLYFIVPMFSKAPSTQHPEDNSTCHSFDVSFNKPDLSEGSSDGSLPDTSLLTHGSESKSSTLEDKYDTSADAHNSGGWLPFLDSLEEARGRLRYGVERKMERVRKNVQHMKESGSIYVQNIMESSSTAASRMRAGVVFGVEAVKYHVQSFKELCGTGDMGAQTISMVSVETDVDSQQRKEVIRQITFV